VVGGHRHAAGRLSWGKDQSANMDTNPACHCGRPSRRRIGGVAPYKSSYLVVQCAISACSFNKIECDGGSKMTIRLSAIPAAVAEGRG